MGGPALNNAAERMMRVLLLALFLAGFAGGAAFAGASSGTAPSSDWQACLPDGVSKAQVRDAVQAMLKTYPAYNDIEAAALIAKGQAWLSEHPEQGTDAMTALFASAQAWLEKFPEYGDVAVATLIAKDLSEGLPCK